MKFRAADVRIVLMSKVIYEKEEIVQKKSNVFVERFADLVIRIEKNKIVSAIKNGIVTLIPVFLIGSVALILLNIPIPQYLEFIKGVYVDGVQTVPGVLNNFVFDLLLFIHNATFETLSLLLLITISYSYAKELKPDKPHLHISAVIAAAAAFVASFDISTIISKHYLGKIGTLYALIVSICATKLFIVMSDRIKFKNRPYYTSGADSNFSFAMRCFVPMLSIVAGFALANRLIGLLPEIGNLNDLMIYIFNLPFKYIGTNFGSGILYCFFVSLLWFLGVHGGNVLDPVASSFSGGILSKNTLDIFVSMGGGGAVICLMLAVLIFSKSRHNKKLALSAAPSVVFNISEVMVFGLPVVFNAVMLIPFLLTPMVFLATTYIAMTTGLVPAPVFEVNWTTPIFFNGYISTGSVWGIVLQLVNLIIGVGIYYPFVRLSEKIQIEKQGRILKEMTELVIEDEKNGTNRPLLDRRDDIGSMAKLLAAEIRRTVSEDKIVMNYQPQMDARGKIIGAEALLRWEYNNAPVFPPLIIKIVREDNFYNELSESVMRKTCADANNILDASPNKSLLISANISSGELNIGFAKFILSLLIEYEIPRGNFGLEITESEILVDSKESMEVIDLFKQNKIVLSIDDFSMGSTSLKYLQNYKFDYVKLDGQLVKSLQSNPRSADIITSITTLGKTLGFEVVAEYVENENVLFKLSSLGCSVFQGWYYSRALPAGEFIEYARNPKRN